MKIKTVVAAFIIFSMTTSVFASMATIHPSQSNVQGINQWKISTEEGGYQFLLGTYTSKILVIKINKMTADGKPADMVTVRCNSIHEKGFREHRLEPGSTIVCKGNYEDTSSMDIAPADFNNGADGTYEYTRVTY